MVPHRNLFRHLTSWRGFSRLRKKSSLIKNQVHRLAIRTRTSEPPTTHPKKRTTLALSSEKLSRLFWILRRTLTLNVPTKSYHILYPTTIAAAPLAAPFLVHLITMRMRKWKKRLSKIQTSALPLANSQNSAKIILAALPQTNPYRGKRVKDLSTSLILLLWTQLALIAQRQLPQLRILWFCHLSMLQQIGICQWSPEVLPIPTRQ